MEQDRYREGKGGVEEPRREGREKGTRPKGNPGYGLEVTNRCTVVLICPFKNSI